jgi:glycosyltransferase 2 family protein
VTLSHSRRRSVLKLVFSIGLGVALLVLVFRGVELDRFVAAIRGVRVRWLVAVVALSSSMHLVRCWRWWLIIGRVRPVPLREVVSIASVGLLALQVLPFRLGEVVRPYLLVERRGLRFGAALYTVVLERTTEIVGLAGAFTVAVLFADLPLDTLRIGDWDVSFVADGRRAIGLALTPFLLCLAAFLFLGDRIAGPVETAAVRVHRGLGRAIGGLLRSFADGAATMRDGRFSLAMLGTTALAWTLNAAVFWATARAFGFPLEPLAGVVLLVVFMVGMLLPAPPLFAGVFEAFLIAGVVLYGVDRSDAAAYAVVSHVTQLVIVMAWALPFLWLDRLSLGAFRRFVDGLRTGEQSGSEGAAG